MKAIIKDLEQKLKGSLNQIKVSKFIIARNKEDLKERRAQARELAKALRILKRSLGDGRTKKEAGSF